MNDQDTGTISIIMAAGRGSRMKSYTGNKALLPLIPSDSPLSGERPLLVHILENLPSGPKGIIVNHCKDAVIAMVSGPDVSFCEQPMLNGTGGAIIAAMEYLLSQNGDAVIITMGDVPFVRRETYAGLVNLLDDADIVVLGFRPEDKKKYGILEIEQDQVKKITEWKYWKDYSEDRKNALTICNSGIYAVKKSVLETYVPILASRPQIVHKEIEGKMTAIEEFFITDIIEYMASDGRTIRYLTTKDEFETMGIDDVEALQKAQEIYRGLRQ